MLEAFFGVHIQVEQEADQDGKNCKTYNFHDRFVLENDVLFSAVDGIAVDVERPDKEASVVLAPVD